MFLLKLYRKYRDRKVKKSVQKKCTCLGNVTFYHTARIGLILGADPQNIIINDKARIYGSINVCQDGKVNIGKFVHLGPNSKICCVNNVTIGDYTGIGPNVAIIDSNYHPVNPHDRKIMRQTPENSFERKWIHSDNKPIILGENVWVGENVRICKGVTIGDNAVIAACSVVTKDVPANSIAAGNPAKIVKTDIDKSTNSIFDESLLEKYGI